MYFQSGYHDVCFGEKWSGDSNFQSNQVKHHNVVDNISNNRWNTRRCLSGCSFDTLLFWMEFICQIEEANILSIMGIVAFCFLTLIWKVKRLTGLLTVRSCANRRQPSCLHHHDPFVITFPSTVYYKWTIWARKQRPGRFQRLRLRHIECDHEFWWIPRDLFAHKEPSEGDKREARGDACGGLTDALRGNMAALCSLPERLQKLQDKHS